MMRRALAIENTRSRPSRRCHRLNNLARLLQDTNRLGDAEPMYRRALAIFQKSLGPDHPNTVTVRENFVLLLRKLGKDEEADKL